MGATTAGFIPHATVYVTVGAPLPLRFSIQDSAGAAATLNLVGARYQIVRGATVVVSKTLGAGVEVFDAANGLVDVDISSSETAPMIGTYHDELELTHADGRVEPGVAFGLVTTRRTHLDPP